MFCVQAVLLVSHVPAHAATHVPALHCWPLPQAVPSATVLVMQPLLASQLSIVQGFLSSHTTPAPAAHVPVLQASPVVHTLLSLHGAILLLATQPFCASQLSSVHGFLSSHTCTAPEVHTPLPHLSPTVQRFLSSQSLILFENWQPLMGSQVSFVHALPSLQLMVAPGLHAPAAQMSPPVQTLPSEHDAMLFTDLQPSAAEQVSSVHPLLSSQLTATPDTHLPAPHLSPLVQALLSSQAWLLAPCLQPAILSQLSSVQGLPSSQLANAPGLQAPPAHTSPSVQVLPSSHGSVLLARVQPSAGLQPSLVQGSPSLQSWALPGTHTPWAQLSATVHRLASLQGAVLALVVQPFCASQPSSVHGLPSSHTVLSPAAHLPLVQASPKVQTSPSLHAAALGVLTQSVLASQLSSVHGLPSPQLFTFPDRHLLPVQVSPTVHTLLSVQGSALLMARQPLVASQTSVLQGLPSSQFLVKPLAHLPALQVSPTVHTLLSLHGASLAVWVQPSLAAQPSIVHGLPSSQPFNGPEVHEPSAH